MAEQLKIEQTFVGLPLLTFKHSNIHQIMSQIFAYHPLLTGTLAEHFCRATKAIASIVVIVVVFRSDGKRFWSQLDNSNTVGDRPYVSIGANRNPWVGQQMVSFQSTLTP